MIKPEIEIRILLPRELAEQLEEAAQYYDVSRGTLIREALQQFLSDFLTTVDASRSEPRQPELAPVKNTLEKAVSESANWNQLQEKLARSNLELVPKGGGMCIREKGTSIEICKPSEVGFAYSILIKRFGEPFPGHPHKWLADRILGKKQNQQR